MKLDCQGCENEALKSAQKLLSSGRVLTVNLEYMHDGQSRQALHSLVKLSLASGLDPWSCVILPNAFECNTHEISNVTSAGHQRIWDGVAAGLVLNCRPETIDALSPAKLAPGYFSDLWLIRSATLQQLQRHPEYMKAQERRDVAKTAQCEYETLQSTFIPTCDDMCRP